MSRPDPERFAAARAHFEELIELEPADRAERLARLAAEDPELGRAVAALVEADAAAGEFLSTPVAASARTLVDEWVESGAPAETGRIVGPWRLLAPLGRGGMGEVWEAERVDGQFEQRAALKLLRPGMDSDEIVARFLRERQILARLVHPGIARLLDGGRAADGRPYLVLEKVDGATVTEHSRAAGLGIDERVRLIAEACDAVESAHRQLVVHRDLKPSNILVTCEGRVQLLDFGIAKLLPAPGESAPDAPPTLFQALTPDYAAPEQLAGGAVTTSTDVHALGLLLFELLVGRLPARSTPAGGSARHTLERPSAALAVTAGDRRSRSLARRLRGDLDRIVARAAAPEPERRYPSVEALAEDLRAHLAGRPVRARGDSLGYRAGKFARRHRIGVTLSALAAVALVSTLTFALLQARRARLEADRAKAQAELAGSARDFLAGLFASADPNRARGRAMTDREMLALGVERIDRELRDRPELALPLLAEIASVYLQLGEPALAEPLARRVLAAAAAQHGPTSLAAARARRLLAEIRYQREAYAEAATLERAALPVLAPSPEPQDRRRYLEGLVGLSKVEFQLGRHDAAAALLDRAARVARSELAAEGPALLHVLVTRTTQLLNSGRHAEGAAAARETAQLARRLEGPDAPTTLSASLNEVVALSSLGRREEARTALAGLPARLARVLGPGHGETLLAARLEARLAAYDGDFEAAREVLENVIATLRSTGQGQTLAYSLVQAATVAADAGDLELAERRAREAVALLTAAAGSDHVDVAWARSTLGGVLVRRGRLADAREELEAASAAEIAGGTASSEFHADTLERLGELDLTAGDRPAARRHLEQALAIRRTSSPAGNRATGTTLRLLQRSLRGDERAARCRVLLNESANLLRSALGPGHPERRSVERELASCPP